MLFFLALQGCSPELPLPRIDAVTPDRGWNGEATLIGIEGGAFYPQVELNANQSDDADLDRGFVAWLEGDGGRYALSSVAAVDYEHLQAIVDAGLPIGPYDLVLEGPGKGLARLEDAFLVSDTRADRLHLSSPTVTATVNDQVGLELELLDPRGERVAADLEVDLIVSSATGSLDFTVGTGLEEQVIEEQGGGLRITGRLGTDGYAQLPLQVHVPDTVTLAARPLDPDSPIRDDSLDLAWLPGGLRTVTIGLPEADFATTAGTEIPLTVRLEDQFGNLITDAPTLIRLETGCGDASVLLPTFVGEQVVTIQPTAATNLANTCQAQFVQVTNGPSGRSEDFQVRAGPASRFRVQVPAPDIRAGSSVFAIVTTLDSFGNRTLPPTGVVLQDSLGGLLDTTCTGSLAGDYNCSAVATVAGYGVHLTATAGAVSGDSLTYNVLPSTEVASIQTEVAQSAVAGAGSDVLVALADPFGNALLVPDAPADLVVAPDRSNESCQRNGELPDGRLRYRCTFVHARENAYVSVSTGALTVESDTLPVVNGAASTAVLDHDTVTGAGDTLPVQVTVYDAYGNPYLTGPDLAVIDQLGDLQPLVLQAGQGALDAVLTTAGVNRLEVVDGTSILSTGPSIRVDAGDPVAVEVDVPAPWSFVGEPEEVRIRVLDAHGNRSPADLPYQLDGGGSSLQGTLVNGSASALWTWTQTDPAAVLSATVGTLQASTAAHHVFERCPDGPTTQASFAGAPVGRACTQPDGQPTAVTVSMGSTGAGTRPVVGYGGSTSVATTFNGLPSFPIDVTGPGPQPVDLVAWDEALCADETTATVWSGPDDGTPVGPLSLLGPSTLTLGDAATYVLDGAIDCTGDPAAGANVWVRTDRGDLIGATPTGSGLQLALDPSGSATVDIDTSADATGGTGTLRVRSPGGGGEGSFGFTVEGDDGNPTVWEQTPLGDTSALVDTITLRFSEPLLESTVIGAAFAIDGPTATSIDSAVVAGDLVTLTLSAPADGSLGTWTVTATDDLRDLSGNRLDGLDGGSPSAWTGYFGNLPGTAAPVTCSPSTLQFRPDGDDGMGDQADQVELSLSTSSVPAGWVASVLDSTGELLRRERWVPLGPDDSWSWDGRSTSGQVLPQGTYRLIVQADDGYGNLAGGCDQLVELDQGGLP